MRSRSEVGGKQEVKGGQGESEREVESRAVSLDRKQGPDSTLETQWLVPPPTCTLAARLWVQPRLGQLNAPAQSRGSTPRLPEVYLWQCSCYYKMHLKNHDFCSLR